VFLIGAAEARPRDVRARLTFNAMADVGPIETVSVGPIAVRRAGNPLVNAHRGLRSHTWDYMVTRH
jgi:hypothetical protein